MSINEQVAELSKEIVAIVDAHPSPSFLCDRNFSVLLKNKACDTLLRKLGCTVTFDAQLSACATKYTNSEGIKPDLAKNINTKFSFQLRHNELNRVCDFDVLLSSYSDSAHQTVYIGVLHEKVADQTALAEKTKRLEQVIEGTGAGTWEWNIQTGETRFNERWAQIIGYRLEELAPTSIDTWTSFCHPDDLEQSGALLQEHFDGVTKKYECRARMKHRDGHWVWVLDRGKVLTWTDSGDPEWMFGTHMDISDSMYQQQALRQSEAFLSRAGDVAGLGGWQVDLINNKLHWTKQTFLIHEVPEDYEPDLASAINFYAPESRPVISTAVDNAIEKGKGWNLELKFITARGNHIWVNAVGEPEFLDGQVVGLIGTFRDITESVKLRDELNEKRLIAEAALEERSKLFAKISHELRTPLNGITGMISTAINEDRKEKRNAKLDLALRSADILLSIINEALDYSKISHGELTLEPSHFRLKTLFEDIAHIYEEMCSKKSLAFECNINMTADYWVYFDSTRLSQIISNLLNNATKFTDSGNVKLLVSAQPDSSRKTLAVTISVSDTGIGIDASTQVKLFAPFVQANKDIAVKYGGSGLGLSIVKELIHAMGGDIQLQSKPGTGSTFTVTLDVPIGEDTQEIAEDITFKADASALRVLVIDDNDINRLVMQSFLETLNVNADYAVDGRDAVDKSSAQHYDILFMDCVMPEMDGLEATRAIRNSGSKCKNSLIIALTANTSEADRIACSEAGMDGFISKPVKPQVIQTVISDFLSGDKGALNHK